MTTETARRKRQPTPEAPDALTAAIARLEAECGGELSLAARNLQTGETFAYHADRKVKTASVIKLPMLAHVAMAVREGSLSWEEPLTLTDAEKVGGSGILTHLSAGLTLSLRDICVLMTVLSDNTGTNMVIEHLGIAPVNARMRELGLPRTTLFRKSYSTTPPVSKENAKYGLGVTTPREMLRLLTLLAQDKLGDAAVCAEIVRILSGQQYRDAIPRLLPSEWKYAGKTGSVDGVRNDVGLVTLPDGRRFALALFCQQLPDLRWTADNAGLLALARAAQILLAPWTE